MEARLLWEQETVMLFGSPPVRLRGARLENGSRGLVAHTRLITESR